MGRREICVSLKSCEGCDTRRSFAEKSIVKSLNWYASRDRASERPWHDASCKFDNIPRNDQYDLRSRQNLRSQRKYRCVSGRMTLSWMWTSANSCEAEPLSSHDFTIRSLKRHSFGRISLPPFFTATTAPTCVQSHETHRRCSRDEWSMLHLCNFVLHLSSFLWRENRETAPSASTAAML